MFSRLGKPGILILASRSVNPREMRRFERDRILRRWHDVGFRRVRQDHSQKVCKAC